MLMDLRDETGCELSPLARVLVYAVMLYPRDKRKRDGVVDAAKRNQFTKGQQERELAKARSAARVGLAGSILLRLIQIDEAGQKPTLNSASFIIGVMWEKDWLTNPENSRLRGLKTGKHRPRHLDAWRKYRPVAHLWAALLLPLHRDADSPTFLEQKADFINFIHVADWFAVRGSRIKLFNQKLRRYEPAMEVGKTWQFSLPERDRPQPGWAPNILPLTKPELRALSSVKTRMARRAS